MPFPIAQSSDGNARSKYFQESEAADSKSAKEPAPELEPEPLPATIEELYAIALPEAATEEMFPPPVPFAVPFASVPFHNVPLNPPGNVELTAPFPTVALLAFAKTMTVCSTITSVTGCTNCVTSSFRISSTAIARV